MAEPTCPKCQATGIEKIVSKNSVERSRIGTPWFIVVYCKDCGHIYNVMPKHVFTQNIAKSKFIMPDIGR